MLGKLIKYEFKATGRNFLPIYAALFVVALFLNISLRFMELEVVTAIAGFTLFGLMIALAVVSLMTIIQRFKNNLLGDEGYLMFTLPVSTEKLILSKLITAAIWLVASVAVALLSGLVIVANGELVNAMRELIVYFPKIMNAITVEHIYVTLLLLLCLLLQTVLFILLVYTSLSISQMAVFHKNRGLVSFFAFIAINILLSTLVGTFFGRGFNNNGFFDSLESIKLLLHMAIGINAVIGVGLFAATDYLLKRHLNIE